MRRPTCKYCDYKLVTPSGPPDADILIFGEFPGKVEIYKGEPWVGPAGKILRRELGRVDINPAQCRITNLWLHVPPKRGTKTKPNPLYPIELDYHFLQLMEELKGRKAILMMGSDVAPIFLGRPISEVTGCHVKSDIFPKSVKVAVAMIDPAAILHTTVGEVRLALDRFSEAYHALN